MDSRVFCVGRIVFIALPGGRSPSAPVSRLSVAKLASRTPTLDASQPQSSQQASFGVDFVGGRKPGREIGPAPRSLVGESYFFKTARRTGVRMATNTAFMQAVGRTTTEYVANTAGRARPAIAMPTMRLKV